MDCSGPTASRSIFYLHGFASSPSSGKARFFADRLAELGLTLECPDLNLPHFATLTVTRMLDQLDAEIDRRTAGPVTLIGSSLGGFAAVHSAARRNGVAGQPRPVERLILLAPALDFPEGGTLEPIVDDWRRAGRREVFHYGYGQPMDIGFGLYEDALQYNSHRVHLDTPILIFQGGRDQVVNPAAAVEFARCRPGVTLRLLDDDHQLQGHLPEMWRESASFLRLAQR